MNAKRVVSLVMAVIILLGSLGWIASMIVSAAETDPQPTDTEGVTYLLDKVYSIGSASDKFSSYLQYDRTETSKYPNFKIKSGYSADFTLKVVDKSITTNPNYAEGTLKAVADSGSFSAIKSQDDSGVKVKDIKFDTGKSALVYTLEASKLRYSGDGKTLGITITNADNSYSHNISLEITQCVPYVETTKPPKDDDDDVKPKTATPYIIVSNYNYGSIITAGETFNLTLTALNTSSKTDIENVVMKLTMPEGLSITSSSNTFYFTNIDAKESITKTIQIQAKPNSKPESQQIQVEFKYEFLSDSAREGGSTSETIAIPVTQPDRFTADPIDMIPEIIAGEEVPVSVNYINKGRGEIYNLSAEISGNFENPGQRQNIGNIEAGKSGSVDFYINCQQAGNLEGTVTFTYEDVNMVIKTVTVPFTSQVIDFSDTMGPGGEFPGEGFPPEGEIPEEQNGWGKYVVIGGIAALVIAVVTVVVIKKKKAAKAKEEDEDEGDED